MLVVIVLGVIAVTQAKIFMSGATSDVEPANVTAVSSEDGKSATISWTSEKESIAKIEYGTTAASLVLMMADSVATTNHNLTLSQLRPATNYYYRIRVGDEVFDNGGMPYIFKTKGEAVSTITPIPTIVSGTPSTVVPSTSGKIVCDMKTDYNKDGTINSKDVITCKNQGGVIPTPTVATKIDCSKIISDYNSDGVINSLDRINCLQSQR